MASSTNFPAHFFAAMIACALPALAARRCCRRVFAASIVCYLFITGFAWAAGDTEVAETTDKKGKYSIHDYKARFLPSVWSVFVEGEFETVTSLGSDVSVAFDSDLGYDDPYPTFNGEASFRRGRHDFWITGVAFDQSENAPVNVEFTIDDNIFNVGGVVDTEATITDINFTYGYSFFDFEEDGFRLGPTVAVSYTDISHGWVRCATGGVKATEHASLLTGNRFRARGTGSSFTPRINLSGPGSRDRPQPTNSGDPR